MKIRAERILSFQNALFVLSLSSLSSCDKLLSLESNPFGTDRPDVQFASLDLLGASAEKVKTTQDGDQQLIEQFAHDYLSQGAVAELLSTERARHSMPPVMVNNPSGASTPLGVQKTFHRSVSISVADWRPSRPSPDSAPSGSSEDNRLAALVNGSSGSPIINFIMSFTSDLNAITATMVEAVRRLTCRVYALQAMRWLLHSVSQPTCLHDILWCFVSSLSSGSNSADKDDENVCLCNHPLEDLAFGEAFARIRGFVVACTHRKTYPLGYHLVLRTSIGDQFVNCCEITLSVFQPVISTWRSLCKRLSTSSWNRFLTLWPICERRPLCSRWLSDAGA